MAASKQGIINSDARLDVDAEFRDDTLLRHALSVPIETNGQVAGVLAFYSREADGFVDHHLHLARAAARIIGTHTRRQRAALSQPAA